MPRHPLRGSIVAFNSDKEMIVHAPKTHLVVSEG